MECGHGGRRDRGGARLLSSKPRPQGWAERRRRLDEVGSVWPVAADIALEPVDLGGIPGEWSMAPGSDAARVLIFFHGGGYLLRLDPQPPPHGDRGGPRRRARTLAVGYRLAPEHPFPAALDDALTAWRFVRGQGVPARSIAVGGDSAGGGLTVALLNGLKAAGEELPACAWLVSPWTDLTMSGATLATRDAVDPLIHKAYLEELAAAYVPAGIDRKDPRFSVLYADLAGLPPTLIQVGSAETLLDDAVRFAAAAGDAGRGRHARDLAAHDPCLAPVECPPGSRPPRARRNAGAFLQRHLGEGGGS